MDKIKTDRINYYFLLSLLIHLCLFIFLEKKKETTLGEQIIPIEVLDNLLDSGIGEATKRRKVLNKRDTSKEKKDQNNSDQMNLIKDNKLNKKNITTKKIEEQKINNKKLDSNIYKEEKGSGANKGIKNNEPEKGSLKGSGEIKVTCLKCVRPIYPPVALRRGLEGNTTIKIWINKYGQVTQAKLITKSGIESIDNAALKAAKTSTFYPLDKNIKIDIEYNLKIK